MQTAFETRLRLLFTAAGTDVTADIVPDLLSFSYEDKESGEADEIQLALKDETGKWAGTWKPDGGEVVEAYIGTSLVSGLAGPELFCGRFYVDSISVRGAPRQFEMRAISTPLKSAIRRKQLSRAWEGQTLGGIARLIAEENGLDLLFDVETDPAYDRKDQKAESNLAFLSRLCEDEGFSLKVTDEKIVIFDQVSYEKKEPIATIALGVSDVLSWSFDSQQSDTYKTCTVAWRDLKKKQKASAGGYDFTQSAAGAAPTPNDDMAALTTLPDYRAQKNPAVNYCSYTDPNVGEEGQEYRLKKRVTSKAEAERLAKATLRKLNARKVTGTITTIGNLSFLAGCVVACEGFGSFDGRFIITSASHAIGSGGYTTTINLRRINTSY